MLYYLTETVQMNVQHSAMTFCHCNWQPELSIFYQPQSHTCC